MENGEKLDKSEKLKREMEFLNELKSGITGHPRCHKCDGSGVLGIIVFVENGEQKATLRPCKCAMYGDTEYKRLTDLLSQLINRNNNSFLGLSEQSKRLAEEVSQLSARMNNLFLALDEYIIDIHRSTPFGFIAWKISELCSYIKMKYRHQSI